MVVVIDYSGSHLFGAYLIYYSETVVEFYSFEASGEVGCLPVLGAGVYLDSAAQLAHFVPRQNYCDFCGVRIHRYLDEVGRSLFEYPFLPVGGTARETGLSDACSADSACEE